MPAVSGTFYPSNKEELSELISTYLSRATADTTLIDAHTIGVIVPHAGYIYSGQTASYSYKAMQGKEKESYVVIGPNHSSYPPESSIYPPGKWITPMGETDVSENLVGYFSRECPTARINEKPHIKEHSVEVQLPFLQYISGSVMEFLPIIMGRQDVNAAQDLAEALFRMKNVPTVVASSDLTHYEPLEQANKKDRMLLDAILSLDLARFYRTLMEHMITACGYGPIAVIMHLTRRLGGRIKLLNYSTSYEASGDPESVVGYASLVAYIPGE